MENNNCLELFPDPDPLGLDRADVDPGLMPWTKKLVKNDKTGKITEDLTNYATILQNDDNLKCLRFNALSGGVEIDCSVGIPVWHRNSENPVFNDCDLSGLKIYLNRQWGLRATQEKTVDALNQVAAARKYHPVQEYFDGLVWDGISRVDSFLTEYLGVAPTPENLKVWHLTVIGVVKKVYNPCCKHDTMLILQGSQGKGKSTLLRKLGMQWYTDALKATHMSTKEGWEKVTGCIIVEIQEMAGMSKAHENDVKAFLSRTEDRLRPAYGKGVVINPVSSVTFGTTNCAGFLKDTTGNRRFWPLPVEVVQHAKRPWDLTQADVDLFWAEAVALYKAGDEKNYLDLDDSVDMRISQLMEARCNTNLIMGIAFDDVANYLDLRLPTNWFDMSDYERSEYVRNNLGRANTPGRIRRNVISVSLINKELLNGQGKIAEIERALKALGWQPYENYKSDYTRFVIAGYESKATNVFFREGHREAILESKERRGENRLRLQYTFPDTEEPLTFNS